MSCDGTYALFEGGVGWIILPADAMGVWECCALSLWLVPSQCSEYCRKNQKVLPQN